MIQVLTRETRRKRAATLRAAYTAHPERFVTRPPRPPKIPARSWINPPQNTEAAAR